MSFKKRVLVCPLDWGLGHATRCIPLIRALLDKDVDVLIAADGDPLALLKEEFPQLEFITLPGCNIYYSKLLPMTLFMFLQSPKILFNIVIEHKRLKRIIRDKNISCVISDNRYGLWNKGVYTIFLTHQLAIKCPNSLKFLEPLLNRINHYFINKFDECWIPDSEGENNLSGELSHHVPLPVHGKFIGLLSRFDSDNGSTVQRKYDVMAIISGPEPHRSLLQKNVLSQLKRINLSALIVSGEPEKNYDKMVSEKIRIVSHLKTEDMKAAIVQSGIIICRAGYSGIMDLVALKKRAILVPTPGQTEQEYLAEYLKRTKIFYAVNQKELNIDVILNEANRCDNFHKINVEIKYISEIRQLLEKINEQK